MERTFVMVKPDGVARGLIGEVIRRLEQKGLKIVALKMLQFDSELARRHYAEHVEKDFFPDLEKFITSGPVVAMVVEGERAIYGVRQLNGATNPHEALPGTIRGDLANQLTKNVVHGSDSKASAEREIHIFFTPDELHDHQRSSDQWV